VQNYERGADAHKILEKLAMRVIEGVVA